MPAPDLLPSERRSIWMEIGVVIALGVLIHVLSVVFGRMHPHDPGKGRDLVDYLYGTGASLQIIIPLLWIMHRSGRSWLYFGIRPVNWRLDSTLAVLVAAIILASHYAASCILYSASYLAPWTRSLMTFIEADHAAMAVKHTPPTGAASWAALAVYMVANGLGEELVLRAYLLARIREITGRPFLAVLTVSALAASYHLYQGSYSGLIIFFGQAVLCLLYLKIRRVLPFALGHALYDSALVVWYASRGIQ